MLTTTRTLWRIATFALAVVLGLVLTIVLTSTPAFATTGDPTGPVPVVAFTFDPAAVVQLVIAVILPVLVGLVTTRVTASGRKAAILASLTLVTSLLVELGRSLDAGTTYDLGVALVAALSAFVVSVATHYGLWKPTGTSTAAQDALGGRHRAEAATDQ